MLVKRNEACARADEVPVVWHTQSPRQATYCNGRDRTPRDFENQPMNGRKQLLPCLAGKGVGDSNPPCSTPKSTSKSERPLPSERLFCSRGGRTQSRSRILGMLRYRRPRSDWQREHGAGTRLPRPERI